MSNKELYDKVISAYKNGDANAFNAAARNFVEETEAFNFENSEANELFHAAKRYCSLWRGGAINGRVSKLRMIESIRKIAEKNLPNPYDEHKEPIHVLGVIPEENNNEEIAEDVPEEKDSIETSENEVIEEEPQPRIQNKKDRLFARHKKR